MSTAKCLDPMAVGCGQFSRPFGQETIVLFLQFALLSQRCLPAPFQLTRHQAVLRLDGVILPSRAIGLDPCPFQPLLPVLVQPLSLALEIGKGLLMQLKPGRLERPQHFRGDQGLEILAGETLADRLEQHRS